MYTILVVNNKFEIISSHQHNTMNFCQEEQKLIDYLLEGTGCKTVILPPATNLNNIFKMMEKVA